MAVKPPRLLRARSRSGTSTGATLEQIAQAAGVSTATVSRYFNTPQVVAPDTAARISAAVSRFGYVPNLLAGGLASNRSRLVAVVIPEISQPIFSSTIQSITDSLAAAGYSVLLGLTGIANEHADRQLFSIIGRRPDGIILTGSHLPQSARQRLRDTGICTIETWDLPRDPIDLTVGFSHLGVGREVARHALAAGRRHALVICASGQRAGARRDGFLRAMLKAGAPTPALAGFGATTTYSHGREAVARHLDGGGRLDLVVCSSDWSAHGALDEVRSRGMQVPGDVAVIGFGDLSFAAELSPSLTSVKIDGSVIGREAVKMLTLRAAGKAIRQSVVDVGFSLILRESG